MRTRGKYKNGCHCYCSMFGPWVSFILRLRGASIQCQWLIFMNITYETFVTPLYLSFWSSTRSVPLFYFFRFDPLRSVQFFSIPRESSQIENFVSGPFLHRTRAGLHIGFFISKIKNNIRCNHLIVWTFFFFRFRFIWIYSIFYGKIFIWKVSIFQKKKLESFFPEYLQTNERTNVNCVLYMYTQTPPGHTQSRTIWKCNHSSKKWFKLPTKNLQK